MKRSTLFDRYCPIARSGASIVDAWTFVIMREMYLNGGRAKFRDLEEQTGMSPRSLTLRLGHLVEEGMLAKQAPAEGAKRAEYVLTEMGMDFWPVVIALKQWGDKWQGPWEDGEIALSLSHGDHAFEGKLTCKECGEDVTMFDLQSHMSTHMLNDRADMTQRHKSK